MPPQATFDEILDAVDRLSPDQQADLLHVVQRRLAEQGRHRIVEDARNGLAEFNSGGAQRVAVDDIMREIES